MRKIVITALLLAVTAPAIGQPVLSAPQTIQRRGTQPAQPAATAAVSNPTNLQLQVQLQELSTKLDDIANQLAQQQAAMAAQKATLATIDNKLAALATSLADFRKVSDQQYANLRTATWVACVQVRQLGDMADDLNWAVRHCNGENATIPGLP